MFPLTDTIRSRSTPFVTWLLILLNGIVFMRELALPPERLEQLVFAMGLVPARLMHDAAGAWTTVISSMFLHGGWMHFVGNMWTLYIFGDNVEDRMGPARYLAFYLLGGVAAGLAHCLTDPQSAVPLIGASGAISAVLGAYFVLYPRARVITLVPVLFLPYMFELPAVTFFVIWFVTQLLSGMVSLAGARAAGGVAWWAHVGGFVAGMVLLPLFLKPRKRYRQFYPDEYWPW